MCVCVCNLKEGLKFVCVGEFLYLKKEESEDVKAGLSKQKYVTEDRV